MTHAQAPLRHLDLFSGIGGLALATEMVWENVEHTFCDNEPFAQAVLKKHWPNSRIYGDIKDLNGEDIGAVDLLTGGFPCQPFSGAGKRAGTKDDRHLWPEMLRVIRATQPRWVIGENVGGLLTWNGGLVLHQVCADLEAEGYEVRAFVIPACGLNAPHRRDRVWIIAHSQGVGHRGCAGQECGVPQRNLVPPQPKRRQVRDQDEGCFSQYWPDLATRLCSVDDGLPGGLARPRGWRNAALKGTGNAVVPQIAAELMRALVMA